MTIRVLIVDDDVYVGKLHMQYVQQVPGFEPLEPVRDFRSAQAVLAEGGVDLLLADCVLPDGNGVDLVRQYGVDAIVLSAVNAAQVVRSALNAGALAYLIKPFDASQLESLLRRYARYRRIWERGHVEQGELERALRALHDTRSAEAVTSTSARILEVMAASAEPMTASALGAALGVSRATAQRHLAKLAASEQIAVELRYGNTGRPEHLYSVQPEA